MPSSLAMNHSSALEYSSQLPVSVYGTGCFSCFSWDLLLVFASLQADRLNVDFRHHVNIW
nr:hypothetical protein [uncultured bacterium]